MSKNYSFIVSYELWIKNKKANSNLIFILVPAWNSARGFLSTEGTKYVKLSM